MKRLALLAALFFAFVICSRARAASPDVVILVPGYATAAQTWGLYQPALTSQGFTVVTFDFTSPSFVDRANQLKAVVDAQPADARVHIIGHASGGTIARYYLKVLGGADRVSSYAALDSGEYGNWLRCWFYGEPDMCPDSPFITTLNAGDDTPGSLPYFQYRATAKDVLDGGVWLNDRFNTNTFTIPYDMATYSLVLSGLRGATPGVWKP